jgi:hypothetical protein
MTTTKVTIKRQVWDLALVGTAILLIAFAINLKFVFTPMAALALALTVAVVYRVIVNGTSRTNKILKFMSLTLALMLLLFLLVTLIIL